MGVKGRRRAAVIPEGPGPLMNRKPPPDSADNAPTLPPSPQETPEAAEGRLVTVERESSGESLVFLARTRNATEVAELNELFADLKAGCHVRILARGPMMAAAIKVSDDTLPHATSELMRLLETVGERYSFFKVEMGLHPTLHRLIEDMALDTGSELYPAPSCSLCARPEPFPTRLKLEGPNQETAEGRYCGHCVTRLSEGNERELVGALLQSDTATFGEGAGLELSPRPSRKGKRVRYRVRKAFSFATG